MVPGETAYLTRKMNIYWDCKICHTFYTSSPKVKMKVAQSCLTLCDPTEYTVHGILQAGILEWVDRLSLLQGTIPTQGSSPGLPHCRWTLYRLSHKGSPRILEWVVYPFSSRSSQPRNWTGVSCIAGRFFTSWATREAHVHQREKLMTIFKEILD